MAWERADPVKLLGYAKRCYEEGRAHLSRGDPYTAAASLWESVWLSTLALMSARRGAGAKPRVTWREMVEEALRGMGLEEREAKEWAAFFVEARARLYGEIYMARVYEEKEHKQLMERVGEYVSLVHRLLSTHR